MGKRKEFINKIKYKALLCESFYNFPASILISMACLESDFGKSELAQKANNIYGMKIKNHASYNLDIPYQKKTNEYENNEKIEIIAEFKKYDDILDSMIDVCERLTKHRYYKKLQEVLKDIVDFHNILSYAIILDTIVCSGYSTDPEYAIKNMNIIEKYNLGRLMD